jgi:hypothetical protein
MVQGPLGKRWNVLLNKRGAHLRKAGGGGKGDGCQINLQFLTRDGGWSNGLEPTWQWKGVVK